MAAEMTSGADAGPAFEAGTGEARPSGEAALAVKLQSWSVGQVAAYLGEDGCQWIPPRLKSELSTWSGEQLANLNHKTLKALPVSVGKSTRSKLITQVRARRDRQDELCAEALTAARAGLQEAFAEARRMGCIAGILASSKEPDLSSPRAVYAQCTTVRDAISKEYAKGQQELRRSLQMAARMGFAIPGAILELPEGNLREIDAKLSRVRQEAEQECMICTGILSEAPLERAKCRECSKVFHIRCLRQWFGMNARQVSKCPHCRCEFRSHTHPDQVGTCVVYM